MQLSDASVAENSRLLVEKMEENANVRGEALMEIIIAMTVNTVERRLTIEFIEGKNQYCTKK